MDAFNGFEAKRTEGPILLLRRCVVSMPMMNELSSCAEDETRVHVGSDAVSRYPTKCGPSPEASPVAQRLVEPARSGAWALATERRAPPWCPHRTTSR